jgi:hypothetical protein
MVTDYDRTVFRNGHRLLPAEGGWWRCVGCRAGFRSDLTGEPDVLPYRDARGRLFRECPTQPVEAV